MSTSRRLELLIHATIRALAFMLALPLLPAPAAGSWMDAFEDPTDGAFDVSDYLLTRKGVLPVPILITEPAVGYGGGGAVVFFQQSVEELLAQAQGRARYRPPNVYAAAGFGTENGTWGSGAGGMVTFGDDRWRWRGGGAYVRMNLTFYGLDDGALGSGAGYTLEGVAVSNRLLHRLARGNGWVAVHQLFLRLDSAFDLEASAPFPEEERRSSGIGPSLEYDSRDNLFTPSRGWNGVIDAMYYDPTFGSDASFQTYRGRVYAYAPLSRRFGLGARFDARNASGDVPFYMLPDLELRGIPALRYQGPHTALLEGELTWRVTGRYSMVGFYGAGRAWGADHDFDAADTHDAGGAGFRYFLARKLGLHSGLDFAWGPEFAFYLQIGSAWH